MLSKFCHTMNCTGKLTIDPDLKLQIVKCPVCNEYYKVESITKVKKSFTHLGDNLLPHVRNQRVAEAKKFTTEKALKIIEEHIRKIHPETYILANFFQHHSKEKFSLHLCYETEIEKYVDSRKYGFIFREYDDHLTITDIEDLGDDSKKSYLAILNKYTKKLFKDQKVKKDEVFQIENSLRIGDKNTLTYEQNILINIPGKMLTQALVKKFISKLEI